MEPDEIFLIAVLGIAAWYFYKGQAGTTAATNPNAFIPNYNPVNSNGGYPVNSNPLNSIPDYGAANNPPADVSGQYAAGTSTGITDPSAGNYDPTAGDLLPGSGGNIDPVSGQVLDGSDQLG